jgi:hypothetical protein
MTRNTSEAASGAGEIAVSIGGVAQAAEGTSAQARGSEKAAQELAEIAAELSQLMRQFKIERRDRRIEVSLSVKLIATDVEGRHSEQEVNTINVSSKGVLLTGVRNKFRQGDTVILSRLDRQEKYLISWVGEEKSPKATQIGLSATDPASTFWNDVIERYSPEAKGNAETEASEMSTAAAGGA